MAALDCRRDVLMRVAKFTIYLGVVSGAWLLLAAGLGALSSVADTSGVPVHPQRSGACAGLQSSPSPLLGTLPDPPQHVFDEMGVNRSGHWDFKLSNCGGGTLAWQITVTYEEVNVPDWITVVPDNGTTTQNEEKTIMVCINTTGLAPDRHHPGRITINSDGGPPKVGPIDVRVVQSSSSPQEDVLRDEVVNTKDLALVAVHFGPLPLMARPTDISGDCVVDILDLALVGRVFRR
jgi:hypothetical protein